MEDKNISENLLDIANSIKYEKTSEKSEIHLKLNTEMNNIAKSSVPEKVNVDNIPKYSSIITTENEVLLNFLVKDKSIRNLRKWKAINITSENQKQGFTFTLLCYNVLAQSLLEEHFYLYDKHSKKNLSWKKRWENLKQEIIEHNPEIFCMQEIEETHLKDYFEETFCSLGYKSIYKKRTGNKVDGCAIFFKTDLLNLIEYTSVEFNQTQNSLIDRDNIAIIAKFSPKLHPNKEFIVATTHLLYNPKREDIRVVQTQILLTELDRLSYSTTAENKSIYLPVILTGDFNTPPYSPVYQLITTGRLSYIAKEKQHLNENRNRYLSYLGITDSCQHLDLVEKRNDNITKNNEKMCIRIQNRESNFFPKRKLPSPKHNHLFRKDIISHKFDFKSVFDHKSQGKWEATTYQDKWLTVDYIFYSKDTCIEDGSTLNLVSRYTIPTSDQLANTRIPNEEIGSDHLLLAAKFLIED